MSGRFLDYRETNESDNNDRNKKRRSSLESITKVTEFKSVEEALIEAEIPEWEEVLKVCLKPIKFYQMDEVYGFIYVYTFDHGDPSKIEDNPYRFINNALISDKTVYVSKVSCLLLGLLNAIRTLPYIKFSQLFRGISKETKWEEGDVKVWPCFTSMSLDIKVAMGFVTPFGNKQKGTLFKAKGLRGYYIADFSIFGEKEVLLEPFQSVYTESVENGDSLVTVTVVDSGNTQFLAKERFPLTVPSCDVVSENLCFALAYHSTGDHNEAVNIYLKEALKGNKIACFNLGNCYLFGIGVKRDIMAGLSWWLNCGHISDSDMSLFKALSNSKYMKNEVDLKGLFFVIL